MSLIFKNDIAVCPHCGQLAGFGVDSRVQVLPDLGEWGDEDYEAITAQREHRAGATEVIVVSCKACGDAVVLMDIWGEDEDQSQPIVRKMIAPAAATRALPAETPEAVKSLFQEASVCEAAGALRAAGVLYRAVVEELVKDQGGAGKDLFHQIDSLQGRLEEDLLKDLHESRVVGNESVHHGVTFETEEIGDLASALQEACRVLYEVPAQRQRYRAQRAARVQARKGKR
ncbi:DUF4145 domain-containing protein [Micrococcus luteus]|uniref:DUF4145 domain-containing protein n=1 Tax=Micrococcus luteus TaxID=1270 RepID=UPI0037B54519